VLASHSNDAFLYIPSDLYGKVLGCVVGCDIEASGFGQLKPYKNGYIVTAVHLLDQTCTSVETEIDPKALASLDYECTDGTHKEQGELLWWWHSHVDMPTFWSDTDHEAMRELARTDARVVATVFNRKREMLTAYRQGESGDGYYPAVFKDDLKTVVVAPEYIANELVAKIVRKSYVASSFKHGHQDFFTHDEVVSDLALALSKRVTIQLQDAVDCIFDFEVDNDRPATNLGELTRYFDKTYDWSDNE